MRELIDVVIPMRDGALTIRRALDSVFAQTVAPDRILIVDDGSTDGGPDLVRHLPGVEVVTTAPVGVSHARNAGLRASGAEFVAFLDCDDYWRPDKLRRQLSAFERRPSAAAVNTAFMSVDMAGAPVDGGVAPTPIRGLARLSLLKLFPRGGGGSSTMMVRRQALVDTGGFDERLTYGEDVDMWLRLADRREFEYCPEVLACIVENPGSVTRRVLDDPRARTEMLMQKLTIVEKWVGTPGVPARFYLNCCAEILVQSVRNGLPVGGLRELRRRVAERAPKLAGLVAPNDAAFVAALLLAGVVSAPSVARRFVGYRRRRKTLLRYSRQYAAGPVT
jgi:glycosyltransferase involved in cell wall biosynthesis